jgi:hypothetical protein
MLFEKCITRDEIPKTQIILPTQEDSYELQLIIQKERNNWSEVWSTMNHLHLTRASTAAVCNADL